MYAKVGEKFHPKSERVRPVQYRAPMLCSPILTLQAWSIFRSYIA